MKRERERERELTTSYYFLFVFFSIAHLFSPSQFYSQFGKPKPPIIYQNLEKKC